MLTSSISFLLFQIKRPSDFPNYHFIFWRNLDYPYSRLYKRRPYLLKQDLNFRLVHNKIRKLIFKNYSNINLIQLTMPAVNIVLGVNVNLFCLTGQIINPYFLF